MWSWASSFNIQVPSCLIYYLYFIVMVKNKRDNVWRIFSTCLAHSSCPRNSSYYILTQLWEQDSCFILRIPLPHPISHELAMCLLVLDTCSVNICWMINTWINEWIWKLPPMPRGIHLSLSVFSRQWEYCGAQGRHRPHLYGAHSLLGKIDKWVNTCLQLWAGKNRELKVVSIRGTEPNLRVYLHWDQKDK